jgi:bifunctional DNA-binding transcriptional regulator/antitoxin component of YhaV-PrlF toxin-antitoxin module
MKLQKHKAYKYKGETKYKYVIVIPNKDIEKLGWKEGDEVIGNIEKNNYIISKN